MYRKILESILIESYMKGLVSGVYDGPQVPGNSKDTAMSITTPAPGVRYLHKKLKVFDGGDIMILDYGAGNGRNANYLRELGFTVYAYDRSHSSGKDGWEGVSTTLPSEKFDVAFTSFVLNVVPFSTEKEIIKDLKGYAPESYHIVRNNDVRDQLKKSIAKGNKLIKDFYAEHLGAEIANSIFSMDLTKEDYDILSRYGYRTSKGLQRIPYSDEDFGLRKVRSESGFKIFKG